MVDSTRAVHKAQLRQAYALIKNGHKNEALELIRPVLAQDSENIDAWWLAAHAAPSPREIAFACRKVLTLKPDHWPAQQVLAEQQRLIALTTISDEPDVDPSSPRALKPVRRRHRGGRFWQYGLLVALLVLAIGGFLAVVNATGNTFGLPIGGLFNYHTELKFSDLADQKNSSGPQAVTLWGTLVIGAVHDYTFAGQPNAELMAMVKFPTIGEVLPGEGFKLLDERGRVVAVAPNGKGNMEPLSARLNSTGRYTLRLTGLSNKAQGAYILSIALVKFGDAGMFP